MDLEHSESLSKGISELSIAVGGFLAVLLSLYNKEALFALSVASLFALMFLVAGLKNLDNCRRIRGKISELVENL